MHSDHRLTIANLPTYFFLMVDVFKVAQKYNKNPHRCSINVTLPSLPQSVPCPPQTSARSGSQLYPLTFKKPFSIAAWEAAETHFFISSSSFLSSRNTEAVGSDLRETHKRQHLHVESNMDMFNTTVSSHIPVNQ